MFEGARLDRAVTLSAEPFVGLKLEITADANKELALSAEPFVGLKLRELQRGV